jgi:hypothetical protein
MPEVHATSPKAVPETLLKILPEAPPATPRRNRLFLSIRARLIIVALVAIAPLMVERVRGLERARVERAEFARAQVVDQARGGVAAQREVIDSTRALLRVAACFYAKTPFEAPDCDQTLKDLTGSVPWIRGLAVAGIDGRIKCASDPATQGLNVSDRPYFQDALRSRDFALSDYLISRVGGAPRVMATFPIVKDGGAVAGVIIASIDLHWLSELAANAAHCLSDR